MTTPSPGQEVHKGINRNLLILGAAAILTIGAVVTYIAMKPSVETLRVDQDITTRLIDNRFFQSLVEAGKTDADALGEIERAVPYKGGYIGISREPMDYRAALELATRTASEILSLEPAEDAAWLAENFPALHGRSVWISNGPNQQPALIDAPDILSSSLTTKSRQVYLRWEEKPAEPDLESALDGSGWTWAIEPDFDQVTEFHGEIAGARKGSAWGIIDREGKWILQPSLNTLNDKDIEVLCNGDLLSASNFNTKLFGIINAEGKTILPFDQNEPVSDRDLEKLTETGFLKLRSSTSGLFGVIDPTGAVLLPFEFHEIQNRSPFGYWKVARKSGEKLLWGWVGPDWKIISAPEWDDTQEPIHGRIPVLREGKWGYLDLAGNLVIPCEWDDAWRFTESGLAIVTRSGKRGYIDREGKTVIPPVWDGATNCTPEGYAMVRKGALWGLIDRSGKTVVKPAHPLDSSTNWKTRLLDWGVFVASTEKGGVRIFDLQGKMLPDWSGVTRVEAVSGKDIDLLLIETGTGDQILRDREGNDVFHTGPGESIPQHQTQLKQGLIHITNPRSKAKHGGFIDGKGEWVTRFPVGEWDEIRAFSEGLCAIRKGDKWGYIDTTGEIVIRPLWADAADFNEGVALVSHTPSPRQLNRSRSDGGQRPWQVIGPDGEKRFEILMRDYITLPTFRGSPPIIRGTKGEVVGFWTTDGTPYPPRENEKPKGAKPAVTPEGWTVKPGLTPHYWTRFHHFPATMQTSDLVSPDGKLVMSDVGDRDDFTDTRIPYALPPKFGLLSTKGEVLHEPDWDDVRVINPDWVWFKKNGKTGLANTSGKVVIPAEWDELEVLVVDTASLDRDGKVMRFNFGEPIFTNWVRVTRDGRAIVLRPDGSPALKTDDPDLRFIDFFGPEKLVYSRPDPSGKDAYLVYEPETDKFVPLPAADKLYWTWQSAAMELVILGTGEPGGETWRLHDSAGNDLGLVAAGTDNAWFFHTDTLLLNTAEGWRVINSKAKALGNGPFEEAHRFVENRAAVKSEGKWGFINPKGELVGEATWKDARDFRNGLAAVQGENGLWGFIDSSGAAVGETKWQEVWDFRNERAAVRAESGFWGFVDGTGAVIHPPVWEKVSNYAEWNISGEGESYTPASLYEDGEAVSRKPGDTASSTRLCALAYLDNRDVFPQPVWTVLDHDGNLLADPNLNSKRPYDSYFHVSERGDVTIIPSPLPYERVSALLGWKRKGAEYGLVDYRGEAITTFEWNKPFYDSGSNRDRFSGNLVPVRTKDQKYGLLDIGERQPVPPGELVLPAEYDRIAWVAPGIAAVWSDKSGGLIDAGGNWIFKDNERQRIARFGTSRSRRTADRFRHGVVVIETPPAWGFAKLNRPSE